MTTKDGHIDPQHPKPKQSLVDALAQERQNAEEKEIAGRHKNDGQNEHKGNLRQPGTHGGND